MNKNFLSFSCFCRANFVDSCTFQISIFIRKQKLTQDYMLSLNYKFTHPRYHFVFLLFDFQEYPEITYRITVIPFLCTSNGDGSFLNLDKPEKEKVVSQRKCQLRMWAVGIWMNTEGWFGHFDLPLRDRSSWPCARECRANWPIQETLNCSQWRPAKQMTGREYDVYVYVIGGTNIPVCAK